MLIVKIVQHRDGDNQIKFNRNDIYSASFVLKESARVIKLFAQQLIEDNPGTILNKITNNIKTTDKHNRYHIFADGSGFLYVQEYNWEAIVLAYVLNNTVEAQRLDNFEDTLMYLETKRIRRSLFLNEIDRMKTEIVKYNSNEKNLKLPFLNAGKMMRVFRDRAMCKVKRLENTSDLLLTFEDVKLGNKIEGYVIYKRIYVVVGDWEVKSFRLVFNDFSYTSETEGAEELVLHPYLKVPYMFNAILDWVNEFDYNTFVEFIISLVTNYNKESGINTITEISNTIKELRKLNKQ